MTSVRPAIANKAAAAPKADRLQRPFRGHVDRRAGEDEAGGNDMLVHVSKPLLCEKREPENPVAKMLHIGKAGDENVRHDDRLGERDGRHLHGFPPMFSRLTGKLSSRLISPSSSCERLLTRAASNGYRAVNAGRAG